ncbi:Nucleotidyltransferase, partial [Leucosporidium creatinivorum]
AASALRNHPFLIRTASEARKLHGIGGSISSKIVEIVKTGTHRRVPMNSKQEKVISDFCGIYGVGRTIAAQLWDAGARSLGDLDADPIRFNLDKNQQLGLRYYQDLQERIPRDEVTVIHQLVLESARKIDPKLQVLAMGSHRRGQHSSSDIDFIVTRDTSDGIDHTGMIKKLWHALEARGIAHHNLTEMNDCMLHALCSLPVEGAKMRRVDFLGVPFDELPPALIYFTGNRYFNRSMRLKARHLGYRLNQRGLYKDICLDRNGAAITEGTRVECRTEKDIFDKLSVPWR